MTDAHEPGPLVGVLMGSDSDLDVMRGAFEVLDELEIPREVRVLSAHRRPFDMLGYARDAAWRGLHALVAGSGGAAHLPGMLASATRLPVIGVPVPLRHLDGMDSLLSIVQMPRGVPVATVAIGNARNAGLLAARMLATTDPEIAERLEALQDDMVARSAGADERVAATYPSPGLEEHGLG